MIPQEEGYDPLTTPFSVFAMRRHKSSTLGWEYCGDYVLFDDLKGTDRAQCVTSICKQSIVNDIKRSLSCKDGHWHDGIASWRERIGIKCLNDQSSPGPTRLIRLARDEPEPNDTGQEREDRIEKESKEKASSAAKARALGLNNTNLSDNEFAERLVHFDDFYSSYTIKFVCYDESVYNFVKRGETTKDKNNNSRKGGKPCAKAIDWYNIMDQQVVGNDENKSKKRKKRKRSSSSS